MGQDMCPRSDRMEMETNLDLSRLTLGLILDLGSEFSTGRIFIGSTSQEDVQIVCTLCHCSMLRYYSISQVCTRRRLA